MGRRSRLVSNTQKEELCFWGCVFRLLEVANNFRIHCILVNSIFAVNIALFGWGVGRCAKGFKTSDNAFR